MHIHAHTHVHTQTLRSMGLHIHDIDTHTRTHTHTHTHTLTYSLIQTRGYGAIDHETTRSVQRRAPLAAAATLAVCLWALVTLSSRVMRPQETKLLWLEQDRSGWQLVPVGLDEDTRLRTPQMMLAAEKDLPTMAMHWDPQVWHFYQPLCCQYGSGVNVRHSHALTPPAPDRRAFPGCAASVIFW